MGLIPDVSAILSLGLDDEDATYAQAVIRGIAADEGIVPTLFWFELRNALVMSERRKRVTADRTAAFLADLALLPFVVDTAPQEASVLDLARYHALTVYDAAYLELARRKHLPLATLDQALRRAATAAGVEVFEQPV